MVKVVGCRASARFCGATAAGAALFSLTVLPEEAEEAEGAPPLGVMRLQSLRTEEVLFLQAVRQVALLGSLVVAPQLTPGQVVAILLQVGHRILVAGAVGAAMCRHPERGEAPHSNPLQAAGVGEVRKVHQTTQVVQAVLRVAQQRQLVVAVQAALQPVEQEATGPQATPRNPAQAAAVADRTSPELRAQAATVVCREVVGAVEAA